MFFFCTLHLQPTNVEVRYSIQATKSLFLQARVFISPCLFSTRPIKTEYQQMFIPYTCQYRSRHMYALRTYFIVLWGNLPRNSCNEARDTLTSKLLLRCLVSEKSHCIICVWCLCTWNIISWTVDKSDLEFHAVEQRFFWSILMLCWEEIILLKLNAQTCEKTSHGEL